MTPLINEPEKVRICAILQKGGTREMAAQSLGCHPRTIRRAADRDPEFAKRMVQAETSVEDTCLSTIIDAAKDVKNWRAAFKLLERIYPERYAPGKRMLLSGRHMDEIAHLAVGTVLRELPDSVISPELRERLEEITAETLKKQNDE
jgi:hypothetical protein